MIFQKLFKIIIFLPEVIKNYLVKIKAGKINCPSLEPVVSIGLICVLMIYCVLIIIHLNYL